MEYVHNNNKKIPCEPDSWWLQDCWRMASGARWLKIRNGKQQCVSLEMGNSGTWLCAARTALWAESEQPKTAGDMSLLERWFCLTVHSHGLWVTEQTPTNVCILFGRWLFFNVAQDHLSSSLFLFFLPSYSMWCSYFSAVLLGSLSSFLFSCLLLRATGKRIQPFHLHPVLETGAASSEQNKEGRCWYLLMIVVSINSKVDISVTFPVVKGVSQGGKKPGWRFRRKSIV